MQATALAHSNIALIKYWGKRNTELNIPAVGSLSITLQALYTRTTVQFLSDMKEDQLILNGKQTNHQQQQRVRKFLDLIRSYSGITQAARAMSENNFPIASGLASSASGFAALTLAACKASGLDLSSEELSILARRGSGSAARSIYGGFVEVTTGKKDDGSDSHAIPIADQSHWPLQLFIVITSENRKHINSTEGMNRTARTSPFYSGWVATSKKDLAEIRLAISTRDFEQLGKITEYNCLKMHATALTAKPGLIYWNGGTLDVMHAVYALRKSGVLSYFTIDAGPQVTVICEPEDAEKVENALQTISSVKKIIPTTIGPNAKIIEEAN